MGRNWTSIESYSGSSILSFMPWFPTPMEWNSTYQISHDISKFNAIFEVRSLSSTTIWKSCWPYLSTTLCFRNSCYLAIFPNIRYLGIERPALFAIPCTLVHRDVMIKPLPHRPLVPMAHEHPYPLAAGTAHASLRRRCASGESIYHMAPIPSLTRSLCSGSLAAREPLPLSRAKWFSGKGVALTSELIPPYPACFVIVEWTLHVAVYSLMYVYAHTTWLPMPWSHVYIQATSSSLFPIAYHSGATPEFSIQIQIQLQLAGTIRKAGTIRELLVASKWQGKARQLHYGAPIVQLEIRYGLPFCIYTQILPPSFDLSIPLASQTQPFESRTFFQIYSVS